MGLQSTVRVSSYVSSLLEVAFFFSLVEAAGWLLAFEAAAWDMATQRGEGDRGGGQKGQSLPRQCLLSLKVSIIRSSGQGWSQRGGGG